MTDDTRGCTGAGPAIAASLLLWTVIIVIVWRLW